MDENGIDCLVDVIMLDFVFIGSFHDDIVMAPMNLRNLNRGFGGECFLMPLSYQILT
jgi:hypothetical protein